MVTQLAELHTFVSLPTIVLLDDIDHYIEDDAIKKPDYCEEKTKMRIARACSVIFDAINSCSRISNTIVSNSIHSHNEFHGSTTGSFIFLGTRVHMVFVDFKKNRYGYYYIFS